MENDPGARALESRPSGAANPGLMASVKATLPGFHTLHLGLIAVFAVVVGVQMYGVGTEGWIADVFGPKSFFYWTVLHMATSLDPK